MAEGKKSFIIYTDWLKYTELMTIEQKGLWIDWCLQYCNDLKPELPNDPMVKMLCVMCKDILKRDLKKYEEKRERFKKVGKQFNNDTENGDRKREPKTECVNSNMLIDNCNMLVCDKSHTNNACACEETAINSLQALIRDLETLFGRCLTMKELAQIELLNQKYSSEAILNEIKGNIDKDNPIAYICKTLSNVKKQDNRTELEKEMEEDEWLKGFYERNRA